MKLAKAFLLLASVLWCGTGALGSEVDAKDAATAVKGWLRADHQPLGTPLGTKIESVQTYRDHSGKPAYHVVYLQPSGFVIVSAEDETEPVVAFVERGHFDPSPSNPLGALVSRDLPNRVAHARAHAGSAAGLKNRTQWRNLMQSGGGGAQPKAMGTVSDVRVAPFLQTTWDQGSLPTTVTNWIVVTNLLIVRTHFTTQALGDVVQAPPVNFTNYGVMNLTNGPDWPVTHGFGYQTAVVDVTNGPDASVTNNISVTDYVEVLTTNRLGQRVSDQSWAVTTNLSVVVSGTIGSTVTTELWVTTTQIMVVSDYLACYNYFTPPHEPRNATNYVCGCVATAMSQLMYYYLYPQTGVGSACFQITVDGHPMGRNLRGGDGNGGPYDWKTMPLSPNYWTLTQPQAQAVGALTSDAGVAVNMQYSVTGSGAYLSDAQKALVTTFKYANAVISEVTNLDTGCYNCALFNMMNPNLDARLPVVLGITGDPGAHAVVCDGYGFYFGAPYHHLNMGWSGVYNAWYALPIIDLLQEDGSYSYFWSITECLYNVYTNGSGEIISGRVLDVAGVPVPKASVAATGTRGGIYRATTDSNGIYALAGVPSGATFTIIVTNAGYYPVSASYSTGTSAEHGSSSGNVWGANFTLVPAQGPPVISAQPQDQTVTVQTNVAFVVGAGGQLPLVYQWQYQTNGSPDWDNLSDGGHYSGSGTATLTLSQTDMSMDGRLFRCIITNSLGAVTSSVAALHITVAPYIEIGTIAGLAGTNGSADGIGANASFYSPRGIAVDGNTNVYVADMDNHVIRKLTPSGAGWAVSTIAGLAGSAGSSDGANSNARFSSPYGVAVDLSGNVYVADTGNATIRELTPSGTNWVVSTLAGLAGSTGSFNGSGSAARFRFPTALAVDGAGNIYVADEGNCAIRMLTPFAGAWIVTTIAGSPGNFGNADGMNNAARFEEPYGITVGQNGTVYVADKYSDTIRAVTPSGGNWFATTIAGLVGSAGSADGVGASARFNNPTGIAAGNDGNLYVADQGNNTIRRLSPAGTNWLVFTIAGTAGVSGSADGVGPGIQFNAPFGIAVDNNTNIYVSDSLNSTIRMTQASLPPAPLTLQLLRQAGSSSLTLLWSASAGHTYRVQFKTNLTQSGWTDFTNVTPFTWTGSVSLPTSPDARRFYRVVPAQ
ncbi:MAG TPA: C10 family peptidase [Candidatus Acidoferrum sp.]|nr:C10 family peptidase [Candidatus Acidoferrum sp.]